MAEQHYVGECGAAFTGYMRLTNTRGMINFTLQCTVAGMSGVRGRHVAKLVGKP